MLSYSLTFGAYSAAFPSAEFTYIPYISFSLSKIRLPLPGGRRIFLCNPFGFIAAGCIVGAALQELDAASPLQY